LLELEKRFASWRKARVKGERIPKPLWNSAAKLARNFGIHQTARLLKLDYYSLKKHVDAQPASRKNTLQNTSQPTFIELPSPPLTVVNECTIELEDASGASLRMHLKGSDFPDVLALGRSFWSAD
jgi:hypothetical protein